ncbi:MAG: DMT family transporter [Acetobacteraceae bacterium]|nr:DMT family transporter [Acetobacteraceae bacterium]
MSETNSDRPVRGILTILGAVFCFTMSDAMAKWLGQAMPVTQINWVRYLVFVPFALVLVQRTAGGRIRVRNPAQQVVRGLLLAFSALLFVAAIQLMPLAEATSVGFISPLLITALSVVVLGEVVRARRWIAIAVGLLGVLVIVRPGTEAFRPAALLVLGSSSSWAVAVVLTRRMSGHDPTATTLLWSAVVGLAAMTLALPFGWVWPRAVDWGLGVALGLVASGGQYLMVQAYRFAPASLLAPFSYSSLLWSATLGWLLFGALPDVWTLAGAVVIVAAGLVAARPERAAADS